VPALANALALALCLLGAGALGELSRAGWIAPSRMLVPCALASVAGMVAYAVLATSRPESLRPFWLGAPLFLLETILFLWWLHDHPRATATEWVLCTLIGILVIWATARLVQRIGRSGATPAALLILFLLVPSGALLEAAIDNGQRAKAAPIEQAGDASGPSRQGPLRRVVLIVVDTLRRDALSCYSDPAAQTPATPVTPATPSIDELARSSLIFEQARSPSSWTLPAVCSLLTGAPPGAHLALRPDDVLAAEIPTLAERMREAGFSTAAFVHNPLLEHRGLERGFKRFVLYPRPRLSPPIGQRFLRRLWPERFEERTDAAGLTRLAQRWIRSHGDEDFFLWLHYFDPHMPYEPPRRFLPEGGGAGSIGDQFRGVHQVRTGLFAPDPLERERVRALYGAEVRFVDEQIGSLLSSLKEQSLFDDTLIVLTSDHGEEFWEHDGFEHGHTMFEELLRVPLLVKLPGSARTGRIHSRVGTSALAGAVLELAGIDFDRAQLDPRRLFDSAPSGADQELLCSGQFRAEPRVALYFDRFKYILFPRLGREELYDLTADPGEHAPLPLLGGSGVPLETARTRLKVQQEEAARLRTALGVEQRGSASLDEATLRELRRLGYVE
jgi:arylsulfatase A-like enzyme